MFQSNDRESELIEYLRDMKLGSVNSTTDEQVLSALRNEAKHTHNGRKKFNMSLLQGSVAAVLGVAIVGGGIGYVARSHTPVASPNVVSHTTAGSSNVVHPKSTSTTTIRSLQQQVQLLQKAVAPTTPRNAADTWAKGIETRNGALQFAVLSPTLQSKMKSQYESWQWTTGTSSPWVKKFSIGTGQKVSDTKYKFIITYTWTDSTNKTTNTTSTIEVRKLNGNWYVSNMGDKGNQRLG